jgi:hypothetical protein
LIRFLRSMFHCDLEATVAGTHAVSQQCIALEGFVTVASRRILPNRVAGISQLLRPGRLSAA